MNLKKLSYKILILINLILVLVTIVKFYQLNNEYKFQYQNSDNINSLNNVVSNYFMGRIETIYLSSDYSDTQIKRKSIWLIPEVLKNCDANIIKLDQLIISADDKTIFIQVKKDFDALKEKIQEAYEYNKDFKKLSIDENKKMLIIVYEDIPHLRNFFRESSDKLMKSFFKQKDESNLAIEKIQNQLFYLLALEFIFSLLISVSVLKKQFSIAP